MFVIYFSYHGCFKLCIKMPEPDFSGLLFHSFTRNFGLNQFENIYTIYKTVTRFYNDYYFNLTRLKILQEIDNMLFFILSVFNPFPNNPWFLRVCIVSLLKTLWEKGGIARNSIRLENFQSFPSNLKLSSANFFSLEESKICRLGKGKIRVNLVKVYITEVIFT